MADDQTTTTRPKSRPKSGSPTRSNAAIRRSRAKSRSSTSLVAYLLIEIYVLPATTPDLVAAHRAFPRRSLGLAVGDGRRRDGARARGRRDRWRAFSGPAVLLLMAFGVGGSILQNPPRIVPQRIAPDFSRLSPLAGFTRLFGPRGWTEFAKSALKLGAVAAVVALLVGARNGCALIDAMFVDVTALPRAAAVALHRAPPARWRWRCSSSPAPTSPGRASIGGAISA